MKVPFPPLPVFAVESCPPGDKKLVLPQQTINEWIVFISKV